ncbi:MAG: phosphate acetyltransferase [Balneolales bacterium]|nr:phosphate acetyltransferase [Balneolales bacterium]
MSEEKLTPVERIMKQASVLGKKIGLPEATDVRTLKAAVELHADSIVTPVLIGNEAQIRDAAEKNNVELPDSIAITDPALHPEREHFAAQLFEARKAKGLTLETANNMLFQPLWFANFMLKNGLTDGTLAGATHTTAEVIRSALQSVGVKKKGSMVSSCFLMILPDGKEITYGDCAVIPYPDEIQLARIAADSAETHRKLTSEKPKVALLSFSTKGSARHERVELVQNALALLKEEQPTLEADGELQFDAAFMPEIANRKAPDSAVAGKANVYIFPNLDAGNIGYKITERVGGAVALGPILQGLAKPVNDLSRGCSTADIVLMSAVTSLLCD